jgi:hypothetical protein
MWLIDIVLVSEHESAEKAFETIRGPDHRHGPPMAILAPYDKEQYVPSTTLRPSPSHHSSLMC